MAKESADRLELTVAEVEELLRGALRRRGYPDYAHIKFCVDVQQEYPGRADLGVPQHVFSGVHLWRHSEPKEGPLRPEPATPRPTFDPLRDRRIQEQIRGTHQEAGPSPSPAE